MRFLRALLFLVLILAVAGAGFAAGVLTGPFGADRRTVVGQLDPEAPELADRLARARAEAANLAARLETVQNERDELRQQLAAARDDIERLRSRAQDAEGARDSARARRDELQSEIERLRNRVQKLQRRLAENAAGAPGTAQADAGETAEADRRTPAAADLPGPEEARPQASALDAVDPTPAQVRRLRAGVDAYGAEDYRGAYGQWLPLAQAGYARAQLHLGALFFEGRGVAQDDVMAYAWLSIAADNGSNNAGALLDRLEARMSADQRRAAERLTEEAGS